MQKKGKKYSLLNGKIRKRISPQHSKFNADAYKFKCFLHSILFIFGRNTENPFLDLVNQKQINRC